MKKSKFIYLIAGSALLSSCQEVNDTSYEREVIKLKAERDVTKSHLKEKDDRIKALNAELDSVRAELAKKPTTPEPNNQNDTPAPKVKSVDTKLVRLGLMDAVDELKRKLEGEKEHIKVRNYSLDKLEINTEYPFNATVSMNVYSSETNNQSTLYWEARGDLAGKWVLSNTGKPIVKNAAKPDTTPVKPTNSDTASNTTKPAKPQPTKPRKPISRKANEHIIDWSKVK